MILVYGKISNSAGNKDHNNKSKETRVVTYVCKYSSGHLIPIIHPEMTEL